MVGDTFCRKCAQTCQGEVLRYNEEYFHRECLNCDVCHGGLESGLFACGDQLLCLKDYNQLYGRECVVCGGYLEGEGVSVHGKDYHDSCFACCSCRLPFPPDVKIIYTGTDYMCEACDRAPPQQSTPTRSPLGYRLHTCAGCGDTIRGTQALRALDKHWHLWCFTCTKCHCLLSGEYMGKEGKPYCEQDYQELFGVMCAACNSYITGKVLQAGEKHYHPQCSRCACCGQSFGEGEEMYLQGNEIWHPRCSQQMEGKAVGAPTPPTRTDASRREWKDSKPKGSRPYSFHSSSQAFKDYNSPPPTIKVASPVYNSNIREIKPKAASAPRIRRYSDEMDSPTTVNAINSFSRYLPPAENSYSYDVLKRTPDALRLPKNIDRTKLETYLPEDGFCDVFGMGRDEFYAMPTWKQNNAKKKAYLF